jgi:DNA polymerase-3 subunit gamma/tau
VELASRADADDLSRCFQGFSNAFDAAVRSGQPRMALEMTLVRLARRPKLLPLDELLARVRDLERRLGGTSPDPAPRGGGAGGSGRGLVGASPSVAEGAPGNATRAVSGSAGAPVAAPGRGQPIMEARAPRTHGALALVEESPLRVVSVPSPVEPPPPAPAARADMDAWRAILERIRVVRPAVASVLEHALPIEVGADQVIVGFESSAGFLAARASEQDALDVLTSEVRAYFDAPTRVTIDASAKTSRESRTVAALDAEQRSLELARARAAVHAHPLVAEAVRLFGAKVQEVKLPSGDG